MIYYAIMLSIMVWALPKAFLLKNLTKIIEDGEDEKALDSLYKRAGLESNKVIVDIDEFDRIYRKAGEEVVFE